MSKVRIEDVILDDENYGIGLEDDSIENGMEKISRLKRTKMKNEENRYKNKKQNAQSEKREYNKSDVI